MEMTNAEIGAQGEKLAIKWLRERGYLIHHVNWRDGRYELDIVARKQGVLHIIEVKSRLLGGMTTPEEAMTHRKIEAMLKAARSYVRQYRVWYEVQLDLIAVDRRVSGEWNVRMIEKAVDFHKTYFYTRGYF